MSAKIGRLQRGGVVRPLAMAIEGQVLLDHDAPLATAATEVSMPIV